MHFLFGGRCAGRGAFVVAAALVLWQAAAGTCRAALSFDLSASAGTPQQAIDGFGEAARLWSSLLEDDVTVRLSLSYENIPGSEVLGFASSTEFTATYSSVRGAMSADATTADDASTVSHLLPGGNLSMLINYTSNNPNGDGSPAPYLDDTGLNTSTIRLTRANAKALGLVSATSGASDGSITINAGVDWDFDRSNGISFRSTDFVAVAIHEIGHALGFTTGVAVLDHNSPSPTGSFFNDNSFRDVSTPDLFRFSNRSTAEGVGVIDWTAGTTDKFFSVDGGQTKIASFATGEVHGDRQEPSHWKDNRDIGVMDPTIAPREFGTISETDIRLFDVIGWNRNFNKTWNDAGGGRFDNVVSWIGGVPDDTHTAVFDTPGAYTVTFRGASAATGRLSVTDGDVVFNLGGATYSVADAVVADAAGETAALTVRSGILTADSTAIARRPSASGQISAIGPTAAWDVAGNAYVGGDDAGPGGDGTIVSQALGRISVAETLHVWDGGTLELDTGLVEAQTLQLAGGLLKGTGQISGPADTQVAMMNDGRVEPGAPLGIIEIDGDYTQQPTGLLSLEIGGLVAGVDFDQLQILGAASLAGALEVTLTDGFAPVAGDRIALVTYGEHTGMFDSVSLPPPGAGLTWGIDYAATTLNLFALGPLFGDTDGDGDVDIDDLNNVRNNFGAPMAAVGDTDFDGDVDIDDLNNVRNNFGGVPPAAVPEPAALGIIVFGAAFAVCRCRRRRGTTRNDSSASAPRHADGE